MERLLKSLIPLFFLLLALVLYTMGMAVESFLIIALGVMFEGMFWLKLHNMTSKKGQSKL